MTRYNEKVTPNPKAGDYVLAQTGLTWSVQRANGDGTMLILSATDSNETPARIKVLAHAQEDGTSAWQMVAYQVFRLIQGVPPAIPPARVA